MDTSYTGTHNRYIDSARAEYSLTNDATRINLQFPSTLEQARVRLMRRCMKIDHIIIEYRNQVPFNATGSVIVEIRDNRVSMEEAAQAAFTFPIACNVDLHYFSSSFFSVADESPWEIVYKVEDSNILEGVKFASIKAKLRLSSAKHSTDIRFKPPTINILSKGYSRDCVDFWSVEKGEARRRLLNPTPTASRGILGNTRPITILPGETWATKSTIGSSSANIMTTSNLRCASMRLDRPVTSDIGGDRHLEGESTTNREYPYARLNKLDPSALDPGDSISQVQSGSMTRRDITSLIEETINKCLINNREHQSKAL
ncbi:BC1 [West African Asystasia virus 1]|uniref:Movement protein BC1 n=1 Tax=West African Asystasia virus 1 TaxID=1046573 RepID=A0A182B115_9GEMI|nr:BC1 [West African Asystasia virus 1]ALQ10790.1 BC1 [West African Asystasia virus 1]ALQ10798.1 BC1 [West African Asystasia virus 1]ALQ10815.1 BC1 [West African Asystasia virus 1]ALQ10824.1 BC1 [West African Asystasia virus 1]